MKKFLDLSIHFYPWKETRISFMHPPNKFPIILLFTEKYVCLHKFQREYYKGVSPP